MGMTQAEKAAALRESLPHFSWTEGYHRMTIGPVVATDGVKYLCETAGAFWLMDIIGSYQPKIRRMAFVHRNHPEKLAKWAPLRDMQLWQLAIDYAGSDHRGAIVTCRADSGAEPAIIQRIEYTDFPLEEGVKILVAPGGPQGCLVAMLPSEN